MLLVDWAAGAAAGDAAGVLQLIVQAADLLGRHPAALTGLAVTASREDLQTASHHCIGLCRV